MKIARLNVIEAVGRPNQGQKPSIVQGSTAVDFFASAENSARAENEGIASDPPGERLNCFSGQQMHSY